ncbi:hypothetical protein FLAG1_10243 [Fusarium langsethiae]|uniref:Uncharacterized protein n=1 Tax=Fusarium langsethiae TaxID=179993 RepID=A0A0N0DBL6_FUSLA|nr:hypothetical protein FLAG1_10243 [Fusarium langsethiae]GKU11875.1 unnamed protein product [Fusarium langsethiae]
MEVKIQFQWLRHRWAKPTDHMDITVGENSMKTMAESQIKHVKQGCPPPTHPDGGKIVAIRVSDNVPLMSGHTFILTMSAEDAVKCKIMLDLQWALITIAAMSGGAEYPELLPSVDDFDAMMQGTAEADLGF